MHLAQVNIGRILGPMDSPIIAEFKATDIVYPKDPFELVNMSVWDSIDSLKGYVYKSHHLDFFKRRAEWFEKSEQASYALWWIPEGYVPTVAEAKERLERYRKHGATPHSFWFSQPFAAPQEELTHA